MFEIKCPLKNLNFLDFIITKINRHKTDKLNIKIVYHCILQVHSIYHNVFCVATASTSFICCKARVATKISSFQCLHGCILLIV